MGKREDEGGRSRRRKRNEGKWGGEMEDKERKREIRQGRGGVMNKEGKQG